MVGTELKTQIGKTFIRVAYFLKLCIAYCVLFEGIQTQYAIHSLQNCVAYVNCRFVLFPEFYRKLK